MCRGGKKMVIDFFRTLLLSVVTNRAFIRTCVLGVALIIASATVYVAYANRRKWTKTIAAVAVVVYIMLLMII